MKKKIILIPVLALCLLLASCSFRFANISNHFSDTLNSKYMYFVGSEDINFSVDEPCDIEVSVESNRGSLDIEIQDANGDTIYKGSDLPTSSFTVTTPTKGRHTLIVTGKLAGGSYSLDWSSEK